MRLQILALGVSLVMYGALTAFPAEAKQSFEARFVEAERFRIANDYPNAYSRYSELAKDYPKNSTVLANYGMLLVQTGNFAGGKVEIDKALKLNNSESAAHQALAVYYMITGDPVNARKEYIRTIALDPRHNCHCGGIQHYLGITEGDEKEAIKSGAKNAHTSTSSSSKSGKSKTPKPEPSFWWR